MNANLIDLIYQNDEVEGVAVFTLDGEMVENQLDISEDAILVVSRTVASISYGFQKAGRTVKGFLLKSQELSLQICFIDGYILLMQLAEDFSANKIEQQIRSIFRSSTVSMSIPSPPEALPSQPEALPLQPVAQPSQPVAQPSQPETQPQPETPDVITADIIGLPDFLENLTKLLKRVSPSSVADKMIKDAFKQEGIDLNAKAITRDMAVYMGDKAIAKIPNKARRKMIEREYHLLIEQL